MGVAGGHARVRRRLCAMRARGWAQLEELMQNAERHGSSFTLFVVSQIRATVQTDLRMNIIELEELARELRDLYFVYTDGLHYQVGDACVPFGVPNQPSPPAHLPHPDGRLCQAARSLHPHATAR